MNPRIDRFCFRPGRRIPVMVLACCLFSFGLRMATGADRMKLDEGIRNESLKVLREGLRSEEFWPSIHAAEALTLAGRGGEVRKHLEPLLGREADDQRRCGLARELVRAGDRDRAKVLFDILESDDPHGHVHAAESLYKVGWKGRRDALEAAFQQTENLRLRLMAAAALAKHQDDRRAMEFLRVTLREHQDPEIVRIAAWVIGRVGEARDRRLIRGRIPDMAEALQRAFLDHALAALGDPDGQTALLRNLSSAEGSIRTYAATFAGEIGLMQAKSRLIEMLDDPHLDARLRAAQALLVLSGEGSRGNQPSHEKK